MKKAVIYARYSSDMQREESIEAQVRACKYYASKVDYEIMKVYSDSAKSGKTTKHRDAFNTMIEDANNGLFEVIIVHKLNRFSRKGTDTLNIKEDLEQVGIELISVTERLDNSPEGKLMLYVIAGMNEFYSANLALEVTKGLRENAYKGMHTGGRTPLGFDLDSDKKLIINPVEAEAVKLIFSMYDNGYGYSAIIDKLTSLGYKTKVGKSFGKNSLYEILRNEKYTGVYIYNRTAGKTTKGKFNCHILKDESEWIKIEDGCPVIIDKATFERIRMKMKENKHMNASKKAKVNYLLSGLIYCGKCKGLMTGETRRYKDVSVYSYYVCNTAKRLRTCDKKPISKEKIETAVIDYVNAKIFNSKSIDNICERIYSTLKENSSEKTIIRLNSEILEIDKKIGNGTRAIMNGTDIPQIHDAINILIEEKRKITLQLFELQLIDNADNLSLEEIKEIYKSTGNLYNLDEMQLKTTLQSFIKKIYVYDDDNKGIKIRIILDPLNVKDSLSAFLDMNVDNPPQPYFFEYRRKI